MKKRGRQPRAEKAENDDQVRTGTNDPVEIIRKIKTLATEVGGISKLKELVEALAE